MNDKQVKAIMAAILYGTMKCSEFVGAYKIDDAVEDTELLFDATPDTEAIRG